MICHPSNIVCLTISIFFENKHPLIPATSFPIFKLNPLPFATLPLLIVTCPLASATVPSAKALKETIESHPALISAPNPNVPDNFAYNLVLFPEPD